MGLQNVCLLHWTNEGLLNILKVYSLSTKIDCAYMDKNYNSFQNVINLDKVMQLKQSISTN